MEEQAVSPVSKRVSFAPSVRMCSGYAMPCAGEGCRNMGCGCLVQPGPELLGHAGHIAKVDMFDPSVIEAKVREDIAKSGDVLEPGEVTIKIKEAVRRAALARRIAHTKARKTRGLSTSGITSFRGHSGAK